MGLFVEFNADRINAWIRKSELDLERSRRAYSFAYRRELVRLRRIDAEKAKTASERHRVRIAS